MAVSTGHLGARTITEGPLKIELGPEFEICLVCVSGELDATNAPVLDAQLHRLLASTELRGVILDLSELEFIDSIGVECLLEATRRSRENDDRLRIIAVHPHVDRVLDITGAREYPLPRQWSEQPPRPCETRWAEAPRVAPWTRSATMRAAIPYGLPQDLACSPMRFEDSYLGRLRREVGSELVLMPGAMVVLQREDGRVLITRRTEGGEWCLPAGAAEVGGSFAATALAEVADEVGIELATEDLTPYGSLSAAESHTIRYPNGDLTHCFALLFVVRGWQGEPQPDGQEVDEVRFVELGDVPGPMMPPARTALLLFSEYLVSGRFQLA